MNWYFIVLKRYTQFSDRASRAEFWWFTLIHTMIAFLLLSIDINMGNIFAITKDGNIIQLSGSMAEVANNPDVIQVFGKLFMGYLIITMLPNLAVSIRRLHDTGKSGWLILVSLIPAIGLLIIIVLFALPSEPQANRYGPHPNKQNSDINNQNGDDQNGQDSVMM